MTLLPDLDCIILPGEYIILEDITHRFTHPCIIDLKMGQRVWDDHADVDKIEREKRKYPAQETLGFRIIGMRVCTCNIK